MSSHPVRSADVRRGNRIIVVLPCGAGRRARTDCLGWRVLWLVEFSFVMPAPRQLIAANDPIYRSFGVAGASFSQESSLGGAK
jgi:hypothetical protein